jgi:hypothetical protein
MPRLLWALGAACGLFGLWALGYGVYLWLAGGSGVPWPAFATGFLGVMAALRCLQEFERQAIAGWR